MRVYKYNYLYTRPYTASNEKSKMKQKVKVGLFGVGLDTYWPQFEGLLARLTGYQQEIAAK